MKHTTESKRKISESLKGKKASNESRRKMSESQKGRIVTKEHRDKISKSLKGRPSGMKGKTRIKESMDNLIKANSKNWIVIDPGGKEYNITNLNKFCKERDLDSGHLGKVAHGEVLHHKGWKCKKVGDK